MDIPISEFLIGVVGVCASGKSTLIKGLNARGYNCRHIAQEHSYVQDMWQRITRPDILIYLAVSYEKASIRKKLNWTMAEYEIQLSRLQHAREHAEIIIDTDSLTPDELINIAIKEIDKHSGRTSS